MSARDGRSTLAILDDDPTGVQTLAGRRVLLRWDRSRLRELLDRETALHLLTNSRALEPGEARAIVAAAAAAVREANGESIVALRGDSTLRGHVLEEYLAVCDGCGLQGRPPLLLVPALPSAGRVTLGGVQYLEQNGRRIRVDGTEFARDGVFAYRSSRLVDWAEERSQGYFAAARGVEVGLDAVRNDGASALGEAVAAACGRGPAAIAVDAETADDVELVAAAFKAVVEGGADVVLRCAPALAGALGGATAANLVALPHSDAVLVVCGSYVSQSRRQLEALERRHPGATVEIDLRQLVSGGSSAATDAAAAVDARLRSFGLAILATPAARPEELADLGSGLEIARGLAAIVRSIDHPNAGTVVKGGVTSAVVLRDGLGAREADVVGPVHVGVAYWRVLDDRGRTRQVLVVPGNVGDDEILVRLVANMRSGADA